MTKKNKEDVKEVEKPSMEDLFMGKMQLLDDKLAKLDAWEAKLVEKEQEIEKKIEESKNAPQAKASFAVNDDPFNGTPIDEMPLTSLREYKAYNERARKENKRLGVLRYPIKQCPVELHPTQKIIFEPRDQPENAVPCFLSNHLIHFHKMLYPGKEYDLPICVLNYMESKGKPVWNWVVNDDGTKETKITHTIPRFALRNVREYDEAYL
jgi:hypothetical protein